MKSRRILPLLTLTATAVSIWALGSGAALAGPHIATATVTRTGPLGNSYSRQTNITTNGKGGYSANSTLTGPTGQIATRQSSGAYNPSTQTYSRAGTTTFANGKQLSFSSSTQATGNNGYVHSSTHTGPNGGQVTVQGQGSYNPATQSFTQSRTVTGPNGNSSTENRTVQVN
jgi:hypothetical protein